jgi:acyl carrier protein
VDRQAVTGGVAERFHGHQRILVQYDTDVFDAETIEALMERFKKVLVEMAAHPGRRVSSLGLLTKTDRLDGWGRTPGSGQPGVRAVSVSDVPDTGGAYRPPATLIEQILAGIYAEVLGVDRVGVEESFFDSGGDSIAAMRAIAAINGALDVELTMLTLVDAPSVRSLAQRLSNASALE